MGYTDQEIAKLKELHGPDLYLFELKDIYMVAKKPESDNIKIAAEMHAQKDASWGSYLLHHSLVGLDELDLKRSKDGIAQVNQIDPRYLDIWGTQLSKQIGFSATVRKSQKRPDGQHDLFLEIAEEKVTVTVKQLPQAQWKEARDLIANDKDNEAFVRAFHVCCIEPSPTVLLDRYPGLPYSIGKILLGIGLEKDSLAPKKL